MDNKFLPIPFNKPYLTGKELYYISCAHQNGQLAGDGVFTKKCHVWLEESVGSKKALLTHSCTAALEMTAILLDIKPGDEIIMPSYTFVSTANAFVIKGGIPVFVDIRTDTLNIDENKIEKAITSKTKAIVLVHYAGVPCEMDVIMEIATRHNLIVVEDAAQGVMSKYKGKVLGSIGHLGCYSFHETKNIISGEGGALLINDDRYLERSEIIREKGTNRNQFFRGLVDKYTWVDIGSSYLPGELISAFLWAQLEEAVSITTKRMNLWEKYHRAFEVLEKAGNVLRPVILPEINHNAHMYFLLLPNLLTRGDFIEYMKRKSINCVFHYVPLHTSKFGKENSKIVNDNDLHNTINLAERIVRMPLWIGMSEEQQDYIIQETISYFHG
jgi:dTDP-4-amino-4,6-dideoxygalactose transaminase